LAELTALLGPSLPYLKTARVAHRHRHMSPCTEAPFMGKLSSQRLRRSETVSLIRGELRLMLPAPPQPRISPPSETPALGDWFNEGGQ